MKYELDQAFIDELAAEIVKCLDEMSGSGTTVDDRKQFVTAVIGRVNDPPPELQTITPADVGEVPAELGISVQENVEAKPVGPGG